MIKQDYCKVNALSLPFNYSMTLNSQRCSLANQTASGGKKAQSQLAASLYWQYTGREFSKSHTLVLLM